MSSPLFEILGNALGGSNTDDISKQLGIEPSKAAIAMSIAIPLLVSALDRNASSSDGRQSLENALDRDHDGSILDNIGGHLGGSAGGGIGGSILGHILGGDRKQVESSIGRASGLDAATVGKLLVMLAPLILGALSRANQKTPPTTSINDILSGATGQMQQQSSGSGDILSQILGGGGPGAGGQGGGMGDLASIGASVLGGLLRGR